MDHYYLNLLINSKKLRLQLTSAAFVIDRFPLPRYPRTLPESGFVETLH